MNRGAIGAAVGIVFIAGASAISPARSAFQAPPRLSDSAFVAIIERFSEPSGYFDTDNLISNEDSYLHPVSTLKKLGVTGGTYVGVGPEQNFSYIAAVRPHAAFIVDIRRDNLLEHLLFKAIFAMSRNRIEYLSLLFGRPAPNDSAGWGAKPVDSLLFYIEGSRLDTAAAIQGRARVAARIRQYGFKLAAADFETISRFHSTFMYGGPALRFNTFGRPPQPYYPDYRRLARELDREGKQASFLATEANFAVVKDLEDRNLIIPLVGDFAGDRALPGVADWMTANHEQLSALYTSNVEQYLYGAGTFDAFAKNVERFPRNAKSVIVRSCFICFGNHPSAMNGYHAVMMTQFVNTFAELRAAGQLTLYGNLVFRGLVEP